MSIRWSVGPSPGSARARELQPRRAPGPNFDLPPSLGRRGFDGLAIVEGLFPHQDYCLARAEPIEQLYLGAVVEAGLHARLLGFVAGQDKHGCAGLLRDQSIGWN